MGRRGGLDAVVKGKKFLLLPGIELRSVERSVLNTLTAPAQDVSHRTPFVIN
jgi:hypothetical protein